jgi:signal transduction histidine kinase
VVVTTFLKTESVLGSAKDFGSGIAPDDHERIFERFERATSKGGLGLGLFLVKIIADLHGGSVR